jgi:hypothetical protein
MAPYTEFRESLIEIEKYAISHFNHYFRLLIMQTIGLSCRIGRTFHGTAELLLQDLFHPVCFLKCVLVVIIVNI